MKKLELFVKNEEGMFPCKNCLKTGKKVYPNIVNDKGLFYARCPKCNYYDKYDFLALAYKKCIEVWNRAMLGRNNIDDME